MATGEFPYKNCKTDFEVLTKVLEEEPPRLPSGASFSMNFSSFVKDWYVFRSVSYTITCIVESYVHASM